MIRRAMRPTAKGQRRRKGARVSRSAVNQYIIQSRPQWSYTWGGGRGMGLGAIVSHGNVGRSCGDAQKG